MKDNVIEQAADELARVMTSPRSYCVLLAEALAEAGLLRPEIDDAMIERGAKALWKHVHAEPGVKAHRWEELGEVAKGFARDEARAVLEAALGGEQA